MAQFLAGHNIRFAHKNFMKIHTPFSQHFLKTTLVSHLTDRVCPKDLPLVVLLVMALIALGSSVFPQKGLEQRSISAKIIRRLKLSR